MSVWIRSSECSLGDCLEVRIHPNGWVHVRNSQHADRPPLVFNRTEWAAFVLGAKAGEFDLEESL